MIDIATNIAALTAKIQQVSAQSATCDREITLIAVSKKQPAEAITAAHSAGQNHFGENYVQEAVVKMAELTQKSLIWHYLGPIQSNKTKPIAEHFDWVHSVDRLKVAQRLSSQRPALLPPLNICLQVNIDQDPAKSGMTAADCMTFGLEVARLPNLRMRGLMVLPSQDQSDESLRASFRHGADLFKELGDYLRQHALGDDFDCLSMGMSGDFELAIDEGSNMVRVGTAIFGPRSS